MLIYQFILQYLKTMNRICLLDQPDSDQSILSDLPQHNIRSRSSQYGNLTTKKEQTIKKIIQIIQIHYGESLESRQNIQDEASMQQNTILQPEQSKLNLQQRFQSYIPSQDKIQPPLISQRNQGSQEVQQKELAQKTSKMIELAHKFEVKFLNDAKFIKLGRQKIEAKNIYKQKQLVNADLPTPAHLWLPNQQTNTKNYNTGIDFCLTQQLQAKTNETHSTIQKSKHMYIQKDNQAQDQQQHNNSIQKQHENIINTVRETIIIIDDEDDQLFQSQKDEQSSEKDMFVTKIQPNIKDERISLVVVGNLVFVDEQFIRDLLSLIKHLEKTKKKKLFGSTNIDYYEQWSNRFEAKSDTGNITYTMEKIDEEEMKNQQQDRKIQMAWKQTNCKNRIKNYIYTFFQRDKKRFKEILGRVQQLNMRELIKEERKILETLNKTIQSVGSKYCFRKTIRKLLKKKVLFVPVIEEKKRQINFENYLNEDYEEEKPIKQGQNQSNKRSVFDFLNMDASQVQNQEVAEKQKTDEKADQEKYRLKIKKLKQKLIEKRKEERRKNQTNQKKINLNHEGKEINKKKKFQSAKKTNHKSTNIKQRLTNIQIQEKESIVLANSIYTKKIDKKKKKGLNQKMSQEKQKKKEPVTVLLDMDDNEPILSGYMFPQIRNVSRLEKNQENQQRGSHNQKFEELEIKKAKVSVSNDSQENYASQIYRMSQPFKKVHLTPQEQEQKNNQTKSKVLHHLNKLKEMISIVKNKSQ